MSYRQHRNLEASIIDFLGEQIALSFANVNIVKGFNQVYKKKLPVICIRVPDEISTRLEIGSNDLRNMYSVFIDIFASSDGQKLDLTDLIIDIIKEGCSYFEYTTTINAQGNSVVDTRIANGKIENMRITANRNVELGVNADKFDKHRRFISFIVFIQN